MLSIIADFENVTYELFFNSKKVYPYALSSDNKVSKFKAPKPNACILRVSYLWDSWNGHRVTEKSVFHFTNHNKNKSVWYSKIIIQNYTRYFFPF